jgi:hypothetical protein
MPTALLNVERPALMPDRMSGDTPAIMAYASLYRAWIEPTISLVQPQMDLDAYRMLV